MTFEIEGILFLRHFIFDALIHQQQLIGELSLHLRKVRGKMPMATSPVQASGADILSRLRSETRAQHTQIEKSIPVFRKDLSFENYGQIIEAFYGYVVPIESALESHLASVIGLHFEQRRKRSLLERDLKFLLTSEAQIAALPQATKLPVIPDRAGALGVLYVLEGATLGGQIIGDYLSKKICVMPDTGGAYYASYGTETRQQWADFQSVLSRELVSLSDQNTAILAAQQTFESMDLWMSENIS